MDPAPRHHLLLLDDDAAALEAAKAALAPRFEVEATRSPTQALQRLREVDFWVVCSAQRLVGLTGLELYERVRAGARPAAFVLFTAPGESAPEEFAGAELASILEKPVDSARLVRLVEQLDRLVQMRRNLAAVARPGSRANPQLTPPSGIRPPTREVGSLPAARPPGKTDPSKG